MLLLLPASTGSCQAAVYKLAVVVTVIITAAAIATAAVVNEVNAVDNTQQQPTTNALQIVCDGMHALEYRAFWRALHCRVSSVGSAWKALL